MRVAHLQTDAGSRLAVAVDGGWAPVAPATRLSDVLAGARPVEALAGLTVGADPVPAQTAAIGPLLDRPGRIFCVGRNYAAHRDEFANRPSEWPEVFLRLATSVTGPYDDVVAPAVSDRFDFEGELGVVIGRPGRHIPAAAALDHVLGVCVVDDLTVRDWQHRGGQWTAGKNFDATLPVGPALVTPDEVDFADTAIRTVVSGVQMQSARTSQMLFGVAEQIEFISSFTELRAGDLIATGTPGGVGIARTPPRVLVPGDVVEVIIDGVGAIRNRIVADPAPPASDRWSAIAAEATVGRT